MKPLNHTLTIIGLASLLVLCAGRPAMAQEPESPDNLPDFQWALPEDDWAETGEGEPAEPFSESTFMEAPPPAARPRPKAIVEVPPAPLSAPSINEEDFRDPFFPVRGTRMDAKKTLEPGVTIDGIRFYNYAESDKFIENYYRESGFNLDDVFGEIAHHEGRDECLTCHRGIEEISENHRFSCTRCHGGRRKKTTLPDAHEGLVPNPSALEHAERFCGKCHADQVAKMSASTMAAAKGLINTTRYAWGEQPPETAPFSLRPEPKNNEKPLPALGQGAPVDDFLRTRCLRCHLGSEAPHRPGDYRASGCAACHLLYNNDGVSLSHDRAIQSIQRKEFENHRNIFAQKEAGRSLTNRRGYPVLHKFSVAVPSVQCEHCHNNNGVGSEFEGLFGKPARPKEGRAETDAEKPVLYGREHEFLVKDIHRERGMHCIDCHGASEIKAPEQAAAGHSNIEIRCQDCHGTQTEPPQEFLLIESDPGSEVLLDSNARNPNLGKKIQIGDSVLVTSAGTPLMHTKRMKEEWVLYSKVTGKKHVIPVLKTIQPPLAHQVDRHMETMECHTCHARWSANEWGLHAVFEPGSAAAWSDWGFADPSLSDLTAHPGKSGALDWLTAKSEPGGVTGERMRGAWFSLFSETGWNSLLLGKNRRGKYSILKPRYQYFITDLSGKGGQATKRAQLPLTQDGRPGLILEPYTPHTIRKAVRGCESCHENPLALGLGDPARMSVQDAKAFLDGLRQGNNVAPEFQLKQGLTSSGQALQTLAPGSGGRLLTSGELSKLGKKTDAYRSYRYLDLRSLNLPRLLTREEFPYDWKHHQMEKTFDPPQAVEDWYFDLDRGTFVDPATAAGTPPPASGNGP
jgi:hypothetical protein